MTQVENSVKKINIEAERGDLNYYQGYHDAMKLVKEILNYTENTYLSNISMTRKIENMYSVMKENLSILIANERSMYEHFKEKFADDFEYDQALQRFAIRSPEGEPEKEVSS